MASAEVNWNRRIADRWKVGDHVAVFSQKRRNTRKPYPAVVVDVRHTPFGDGTVVFEVRFDDDGSKEVVNMYNVRPLSEIRNTTPFQNGRARAEAEIAQRLGNAMDPGAAKVEFNIGMRAAKAGKPRRPPAVLPEAQKHWLAGYDEGASEVETEDWHEEQRNRGKTGVSQRLGNVGLTTPEQFSQIRQEIERLRAAPKEKLIAWNPSRLDKTHLKSEPKSSLISSIMSARFGTKRLQEYFDWANSPEGRKAKAPTY